MPYSFHLTCSDYSHSEPFRVEVLEPAIDDLIADTREAYRVYELMMIRRPGDVWNYLWVRLDEVPESVRYNESEQRKEKFPYGRCFWPENHLPLTEFDTFFHWFWDMDKESAAWCPARNGQDFLRWGDELFERVRSTQRDLRSSGNGLVQAELEAMGRFEHHLDRKASPPFLLTPPGYVSPTLPKRSPAYYAKLAELLGRSDVRTVSICGDKDYQTLMQICLAQRHRAIVTGKDIHQILPFHLSSDGLEYLKCWRASHVCWQEGLGHTDLIIDGEKHGRIEGMSGWPSGPRRLALTHHMETGEIPGFTRTEGDGWVFFEDSRSGQDYASRVKQASERYQDLQRKREDLGKC